MAVSYFNSRSLNPDAQKAYDPAVSSGGSFLNNCSQRNGVVFGQEVQQTAPNNYLNTSTSYGVSFQSPFSDSRFPKVLIRVLYPQKPTQSKPLGLFNKTRAQQRDKNIIYAAQSGFRIDRVWSMAVKANSQSHSINANHSPLDSTLKDAAGSGSSGMGRSTPQISSVIDKTSQKAHPESEKRKASRKVYAQSDKGKATRKVYEQSEKGKASRKAYEQSDKRKASQKAYRQSDKWKAYQKAYQKAYYKVFNNTGDREQAKIAGKQATAFLRISNKKQE